MFSYYERAEICYAHLEAVPSNVDLNAAESAFTECRWFTRGWTLQELIAPHDLVFFSTDWIPLGNKVSLQHQISRKTGIDAAILTAPRASEGRINLRDLLDSISVAKRMSWAANRETTREEDRAYSLMGLFSVNMSMLYGEGRNAFTRLQEEIIRVSDDHSIFAWVSPAKSGVDAYHGLLADGPEDFVLAGSIIPYNDYEDRLPFVMTNRGLSIDFCLTRCDEDVYAAALNCPVPPDYNGFLAVYLRRLTPNGRQYARVKCDKLGSLDQRGSSQSLFVKQNVVTPSGKAVYPLHFFQLRKGPDSDYRAVKIVHKELQLAETLNAPGVTSYARQWIPSGLAVGSGSRWLGVVSRSLGVYRITKGVNRITAAILFQRVSDGECFAVRLGSMSNFEVGFDVTNTDELTSLEEMEPGFRPKPPGTSSLEYHRVHVGIEEHVSLGRKVYVVDIMVEAIAKEGPLAAVMDTVDELIKPDAIKNRRKIWQRVGL